MSTVTIDGETGEVLAHAQSLDLDAESARDLTDRIKVAVEGSWSLIKQAYTARAWVALGYTSWDDYCTREFGQSRLRLPREERQEVVASLRESGLSSRAIAAATGLSKGTVGRDLEAGAPVGAPAETSPLAPAPVATEVPAEPEPAPPTPITGTDGKQYDVKPRLKAKDRRPSLTDTAAKAGFEFRKATERLERIAADDRYSANKEQVAASLRGHLTYAVEVCQDLLDGFDNEPQEAR